MAFYVGQILAHRGIWCESVPPNSFEALRRALDEGFGIETDIRDFCEEIVVSHDPVSSIGSLSFSGLISAINSSSAWVGLNIKSDGLKPLLEQSIPKVRREKVFIFDGSIPERLQWRNSRYLYFDRLSDVEPFVPDLGASVSGIWLDAFFSCWFDESLIESWLDQGITVSIVSSELHGRHEEESWPIIKKLIAKTGGQSLLICTDHPYKAASYFNAS